MLHATDTALRLVHQALGDLGAPDASTNPALTDLTRDAADEGGARPHAETVEGLERAIGVVSSLEREANDVQDTARSARYAALREELHGVLSRIRPQDVSNPERREANGFEVR